MDFNFGEVLTRAWQIVWKHKILWVFGILASCSRGGGGGSSGGSGVSGAGDSRFGSSGETFRQWATDHPGLIVLAVVIFIVLVLLFIFLGTIGRIGLIKGTYKAEQGAASLVLGELFSESTPYFGRVFGLSFMVALIFLIIFIPISLLGSLTAGVAYICLLPLICILRLAGWVVTVIVEQANAAIVLEDLSMSAGFQRGWAIVRSNIGPVLSMALILGVIGVVVGLVVVIPILVVVIPAVLAYYSNPDSSAPIVLMSVCVCLYLPIAIFLQGVVVAYIQSAWTLTFLSLTRKPDAGEQPKLDNTPSAGPEDSDKTLLARSNA